MPDDFDRSRGIGGSDVAAILGLDPYRSQFDVWLEKTRDPAWVPVEISAVMRLGSLLEPALATAYNEDHPNSPSVVHKGGAFSEPAWHPNRVVYAHVDGLIPEAGLWECKVMRDDHEWLEGVPARYEAQIRTYLAVTGAEWCDVSVLFRQSGEIAYFRIHADKSTDDGLVEIAARWWADHVDTKTAPPVDGTPGAARFLAGRFPTQTTEEPLLAPDIVNGVGQNLALIRASLKELEGAKLGAENCIKDAMGEHGLIKGSDWQATWKRTKGRTFVAWEEIAGAYRGVIHQMERALAEGDPEGALRILTDNPPDAIVGIYTRTDNGSRPFVFRNTGKGEA